MHLKVANAMNLYITFFFSIWILKVWLILSRLFIADFNSVFSISFQTIHIFFIYTVHCHSEMAIKKTQPFDDLSYVNEQTYKLCNCWTIGRWFIWIFYIKFATRCSVFFFSSSYNLNGWNYVAFKWNIFFYIQFKQWIELGNRLHVLLYLCISGLCACFFRSFCFKNATNISILYFYWRTNIFNFAIPHYLLVLRSKLGIYFLLFLSYTSSDGIT